MNEQEMLEFAARAADYYLRHEQDGTITVWVDNGPDIIQWNPLTDDADAFRLAVRLGINIYLDDDEECSTEWNSRQEWAYVECGDDKDAAARLAIVRAAAEIGRAMP